MWRKNLECENSVRKCILPTRISIGPKPFKATRLIQSIPCWLPMVSQLHLS
nr:MAG TPA: hypothetical protein [Bacteriophage sp.]